MRFSIFKLTIVLIVLCSVNKTITLTAKPINISDVLSKVLLEQDYVKKNKTRKLSDKVFWSYDYKIPVVEFNTVASFSSVAKEMPITKGDGRQVEHLNRGRLLFLDKKYQRAKATFLSARLRFKNKKYHRRVDYFAALSFLEIISTKKEIKAKKSIIDYYNTKAAKFLDSAFVKKIDVRDDVVSQNMSKGLYNLAVIYWNQKKYKQAIKIAKLGVKYVESGSVNVDYLFEFHSLIIENEIRLKKFKEAAAVIFYIVSKKPKTAYLSQFISRLGDIFFKLHNYKNANILYKISADLDIQLQQVNPVMMVLYGESLFWQSKFSNSQKITNFSLSTFYSRKTTSIPSTRMFSLAELRIADSFFIKNQFKKAKTQYFNVVHKYQGKYAAQIAEVRLACLDLPIFKGNNVRHAREVLKKFKSNKKIEPVSILEEIAWACEVLSYAKRERTDSMIKRVKNFYLKYPNSIILKKLVQPVVETQAKKIFKIYKNKDYSGVISFYEQNKSSLFKTIDIKTRKILFYSYFMLRQSSNAIKFYDDIKLGSKDIFVYLYNLIVLLEQSHKNFLRQKPRFTSLLTYINTKSSKLDYNLVNISLLRRIKSAQNSNSAKINKLIYNVYKNWFAIQNEVVCRFLYPHLSLMLEKKFIDKNTAYKDITKIINKLFPKLIEEDSECAIAILDLEKLILSNNSRKLAKKYLLRDTWPLTGVYLTHVWSVAEKQWKNKQFKSANTLYDLIVKKADLTTQEFKYSKLRLENKDTELEKFWP